MAVLGGEIVIMNPPSQQPAQVGQVSTVSPQNLPPGVESVYVTYNYYGRPQVMLTLDSKARRRLFVFAVILLVFGPLILVLVSICIAMKHYYLAYGYASGILVSRLYVHLSFKQPFCTFICYA